MDPMITVTIGDKTFEITDQTAREDIADILQTLANAVIKDENGNIEIPGNITASGDIAGDNITASGAVTGGSVTSNGDISLSGLLRLLQSSSGYAQCYIRAVDGDANGGVVLIRPGGSLIAGGGEYASNRWGVGDIPVASESTYIGADGAVYIETKANTIAQRLTWEFDTRGNLTTPSGGLINNVDIATASSNAAAAKAVTDKLVFGSATTSAQIGDGTTTTMQAWGNSTNKVAVSATNNQEDKRYAILARDDRIRLYNFTDSATVYDIVPYNFQAGQTFNIPRGPYMGHITDSATDIRFFVPLPRQANGLTVTMPKSAVTIRGGAGYVDDSYNTTTVGATSAYTWTVTGQSNGVYLVLGKSSAFTNVTNNTPVTIMFRSTVTLSFSAT